jgi:hypothetical protein
MLDGDFLTAFKCASEEKWRKNSIKSIIWGFSVPGADPLES